AVDSLGNAYVAGGTTSNNFPTTLGAFQTTFGGGLADAFVTKLNAAGTALLYSTYLGGSGYEQAFGIALDTVGNAYVTGGSSSADFPTTVGAFQTAFLGNSDAFVTKLNATGSALLYSTYLGGSADEQGLAIALDTVGAAYVTGATFSTNFPTTPGAFQTAFGGVEDAFVAKLGEATVPPPPASIGKVTGGGTIDVTKGIGTFGFIVQRDAADAPIQGNLQYVNHASGAKVQSVMFTTFVITGNMATFGGTCTNNGVPCTFTVNVADNGRGTNDSFSITVNAGPTEGAGENLRSGNIQIHR